MTTHTRPTMARIIRERAKLKNRTIRCPLCPHQGKDYPTVQRHIARRHLSGNR